MKKFIVAILAILYLSTSTGATIHFHYCMGELAGWELTHDDSEHCGKCGLEKEGTNNVGFCKVEKKFVKNDSLHKATNSVCKQFELSAYTTTSSLIDLTDVNCFSPTTENVFNHDPPSQNEGIAIYIRHCSFLI